MDYRGQAPQLLAELFEDGGAELLAAAGLANSWNEALAGLPAALFRFQSDDPALTLLSLCRDYWAKSGALRPAVAVTKTLLQYHQDVSGEHHPDALAELGAFGALAIRAGREKDGAAMLESAWQGLRSAAGDRDVRLAVVATNLALYRARTGKLAEAEMLLEQAYRIRKVVAPSTVGLTAAQLGEVRVRLNKLDEALPLLRESWMMHLDALGETHPRTIDRARLLASLLNRKKQYREAAPVLRDIYNYMKASGTPEQVASAAFDLGVALNGSWKPDEGLRLIDEALRWTRDEGERLGKPHRSLAARLSVFAQLQLDRKRASEAEGLMREALEAERELYGESSPQVAARYAALGHFADRMGRLDEALGWLEPAAALLVSTLGAEHGKTREVLVYQLQLFQRMSERSLAKKDRTEARNWLLQGYMRGMESLGPDHEQMKLLRAFADANQLPL